MRKVLPVMRENKFLALKEQLMQGKLADTGKLQMVDMVAPFNYFMCQQVIEGTCLHPVIHCLHS